MSPDIGENANIGVGKNPDGVGGPGPDAWDSDSGRLRPSNDASATVPVSRVSPAFFFRAYGGSQSPPGQAAVPLEAWVAPASESVWDSEPGPGHKQYSKHQQTGLCVLMRIVRILRIENV
jgi:hypothetical protein